MRNPDVWMKHSLNWKIAGDAVDALRDLVAICDILALWPV